MRPGWLIMLVAASMACIDTASEQARMSGDDAAARAHMVETQLRGRDIRNAAVLEAMRRVPRHEFVPAHLRHRAYEGGPLPIGGDQTISQPYIVAYMTQAIEPEKQTACLESAPDPAIRPPSS